MPNFNPGEDRFRRKMENALESGEGFRQWAENNLPIDKYTGEKFPLGSTNLHFFELSNQEKTELNELVKDGKKTYDWRSL